MSLTASTTITVADASIMSTFVVFSSLPTLSAPSGRGRISHPVLGAFDYLVKPDQWVNVDTDIVIPPVWQSSKTLTSGVNTLWAGNLRDVVAEERWTQPMAMPVSQLRLLIAVWTTPVDPSIGYVQWMPNYTNNFKYNVIPESLVTGGAEGIVFDDLIHAKDERGEGWIANPVTFRLRLVSRVEA